jgi:nucleotide-binding universal stress UspA family protein
MNEQEDKNKTLENRDQKISLDAGAHVSPLQAIRRILVALDASSQSLAALDAAVELAARMEAELMGLFVEDINLLELAGLPFAREINYFSATHQQLDSQKMERALKVKAEQARQALAAAAERSQVRWSFRVVRGQVLSELLEAAMEADLLTLGKASQSLTKKARLGSTARAVATKAPRCVLLVQHDTHTEQPVLVIYDGSEAAQRALTTAAYLAEMNKSHLVVFALIDESITTQHLEEEITNWLRDRRLTAHYHWLTRADLENLTHRINTEGGGFLVLGGESSMLSEEVIQDLLNKIGCPILLVR